jgi:GNAT superfamily N-acetyltransferase
MIKPIVVANVVDKIIPMIRENWDETGFDFEISPDVATYSAMQANRQLIALGAFDGDDMVGYSTAMIGGHIFNPDVIVCQSDALFVRKSHRQTSIGGRLILQTEHIAKQLGAHFMLWQTRAGTPLVDSLQRRGYLPADVAFIKGL